MVYLHPDKSDLVRYLGAAPDENRLGTCMKRVQNAWALVSGGRHRCSASVHKTVEVVLAALRVFMKRFDVQLREELCPFDCRSRGFGVKFPINDIKISFKRCK